MTPELLNEAFSAKSTQSVQFRRHKQPYNTVLETYKPGLMMELEDALRRARGEGSSLTRSFWYGKFLQLLPEEKMVKYIRQLSARQWTPLINSSSQTAAQPGMGGEEEKISQLTPHAQVLSSGPDGHKADSSIQLDAEKSDKTQGITESSGDISSLDFGAHIVEALKCLKYCETSLSPNVYDLVVNSIQSATPPEHLASISQSSFLLKDCTLDWNIVSVYLNNEYKDYPNGARVCIAIAKRVSQEIFNNGSELFLTLKKKSNFQWTQLPQLFIDCIEELQSDNPLRVNASLLVGAAAFERALGDVYLGVSKATQCPPLLRDFLATAELEKTFGKSVMYMLNCIIGPPSGLNLRNILWHGFTSPDEISQEYAYLFFVIVSNLGKMLQAAAPSLPFINHRPFITFRQEVQFIDIFTDLGDSDLIAIEKLFFRSFFILPTMLQTWQCALDEFKRNRYGHCVSLLLPCLEHGLRRVFACVNGCPERALTAESTTLYTTFDEILSPVLPNKQDNQLKEEIGVPKTEMLLDLLVHSEGPRVRDRISHGEVDFCQISKTISNHIICVVAVFCLQYSIGVETEDSEHSEQVYKSLLASERKYVSLFHPLSLLRRDLLQLVSLLHNWRNIPLPGDFELGNADDQTKRKQDSTLDAAFQTFCSSCNLHLPLEEEAYGRLEKMIATVWDKPIKTLFLSRHAMEVTGIMKQTVENVLTSVNQIHETASVRFRQYEERQLRSRQRANYDHLLRSLRLYSNAMAVLVVLLVSVAAELDAEPLIRYLKKVLQFAENFKSQTSSTKNRWEEADKLCYSLAEQLPVASCVVVD